MIDTVPGPVRQPGRIGRALIRLLTKQAKVVETERIAEGFYILTLESAEFRRQPWAPGQKLQITLGSAFTARTFTPIDWDAAAGRTRILGYDHGSGPGSAWISAAKAGDVCDVFGPRASLDFSRVGTCVVLGDETSIGLCHALFGHVDLLPCLLEVNKVENVRQVFGRLDLSGVKLFERTQGDAHLEEIERGLPALVSAGATFAVTGRASFVQRLNRALKALGTAGSHIKPKPYWSPGKTGLD